MQDGPGLHARVTPLDDEPQSPSRLGTLSAVFLVIIALGALVVFTREPTEPRRTSLPPLPASSSTTVPATTTTNPDLAGLWDYFPDYPGSLAVVTVSPDGSKFLLMSSEGTERSPVTPLLPLEFDESGAYVAFLGESVAGQGHPLYAGTFQVAQTMGRPVNSFAWHETIPGRIAWVVSGSEPLVCWTDMGPHEVLPAPDCVPGRDEEIVGFDDEGFLLDDNVGYTIRRLDMSGNVVASVIGTTVSIGPTGQILIADSGVGDEASYIVTDDDFESPNFLSWAPDNFLGSDGFAWSPLPETQEIAFLVQDGEGFLLEVWSVTGELVHSFPLEGRVWDVGWDTTGRYILVPGVENESRPFLHIYDTFAGSSAQVPFDDFVSDAQMLTPSVCEVGGIVADAFAQSLPIDVTLAAPQVVDSREAIAQPISFFSARVYGGGYEGDIATWALPTFYVSPVDQADLAVPINEIARDLGFGFGESLPMDYGVSDWFQLDGAVISQHCVLGQSP